MSDGASFGVADDSIVVTWDAVTSQQNGIITDTVIMGRRFNGLGVPQTILGSNTEVQLDFGNPFFAADPSATPQVSAQGGTAYDHTARNAEVAMDASGNFIVVWEAFQDNDVGAAACRQLRHLLPPLQCRRHGRQQYGRRGGAGKPGDQRSYRHDGNVGAVRRRPGESDDRHRRGRRLQGRRGTATAPPPTRWIPPIPPWTATSTRKASLSAVSAPETRRATPTSHPSMKPSARRRGSNMTSAGDQVFPSIAMTPDGDIVVVWSGNGIGDQHGIFFRRYNEPTDTAGPMVAGSCCPTERRSPATTRSRRRSRPSSSPSTRRSTRPRPRI